MSKYLKCHQCGWELEPCIVEITLSRQGKDGVFKSTRKKGLACVKCCLVDTHEWWYEQFKLNQVKGKSV